jgi:hypothetical protein
MKISEFAVLNYVLRFEMILFCHLIYKDAKKFIFVVCVACGLLGCAPSNKDDLPMSASNPLVFKRLIAEDRSFLDTSGVMQFSRQVIKSTKEWHDIWAVMHAVNEPAPALPEIDFNKQMVVVVAMGVRPSGGYSIMVTGVQVKDGVVEVSVESVSPGAQCFNTAALMQPVDVIVLDNNVRPIRFVEMEKIRNC